MKIALQENGLYLEIAVTEDGDVRLSHLSSVPQTGEGGKWHRLLEVQETGLNQNDHHGSKHTGTQPGSLFRYRTHTVRRNQFGSRLELVQSWEDLTATSCLQFYDDIPVVRSWTEITNRSGRESHPLEYISSFVLTGIETGGKRDEGALVHLPHNTWFGEAQWRRYALKEIGYDAVHESFSMKRVRLSSSGSWPCSEYLPMGSFEKKDGGTITWQIETAAAWNWEISDIDGHLYLAIGGPCYQENGFVKNLRPGETFRTVPCAVCFVEEGFQQSIRELTRYRRAIRRPNEDNAAPSVIFNDYMNCLMGDPTEEKEYPLIDAAAEAGCKYYCVDCGWYADGEWWDGVGEWLPSEKRFPNGLEKVLDHIREKGMIPGLWLELEVMGIACPLVKKVPEEWFFQRGGRPVIDHGRYQLDFRNREVQAFADRVVDRLVREYGVGYIKMDYNINAGAGTDYQADSAAEGLLAHTRAYLAWLGRVYSRYPGLVIENCGSGGMRMEYSLLSRHSIQSVTDQTDYLKMAAIACNCMTAVPPEQAAIWSYPLREGDEEEVIFNMVNAMLLRIHQSGHLAELSEKRLRLVREGIRCHQAICEDLKTGLPFWPIGLASMSDPFLSVGVDCGEKKYLAVWRIGGDGERVSLRIPPSVAAARKARCIYPAEQAAEYTWDGNASTLTVTMKAKTARLFLVE